MKLKLYLNDISRSFISRDEIGLKVKVTIRLDDDVIWVQQTMANMNEMDYDGPLFTSFQVFFYSYYYCLNLLPLSDLSVRIDSYDLRLLCQGDRVLRDQRLYLDWSVFGCKKFQKVLPNHFWQVFSFFY